MENVYRSILDDVVDWGMYKDHHVDEVAEYRDWLLWKHLLSLL